MVSLDLGNSRMKDVYDLWYLAHRFSFQEGTRCKAIAATFKRRGTPLPEVSPIALTPAFYDNSTKQIQWTAFLRKSRVAGSELTLAELAGLLKTFLVPPVQTIRDGLTACRIWPAGGPWGTGSHMPP
jgi:hypothetical protein